MLEVLNAARADLAVVAAISAILGLIAFRRTPRKFAASTPRERMLCAGAQALNFFLMFSLSALLNTLARKGAIAKDVATMLWLVAVVAMVVADRGASLRNRIQVRAQADRA